MGESWLFVGILAVVVAVPFVLLGAVRAAARTVPASFRWAAHIERQHYRRYWLVVAGMYVLSGIVHLARRTSEPVFGVVFLAVGLVALYRALSSRGARQPKSLR